MRIGFDVSQTGADKAGCGFVAYNLARLLPELLPEDEFVFYPTFGDFYWDPNWDRDTVRPSRPNVARGFHHVDPEAARRFWRAPPQDLDRVLGSPDLVHSNNFFCPQALQRTRLVYTLYDLSFVKNPDWTTEGTRISCFANTFQAALRADFIMAISEFSRLHFLSTFPHYPADRTATVRLASRLGRDHLAVRSNRLQSLVPGAFWLAVGTIEPRKNYEGLIRAYARLKALRGAVTPLVIAGKPGWMMEHLPRRIAELGLEQDVQTLGYVSDDELCWLYRHCFAFVYPTFWEGFGLPVVEALSQGAPVISSRVSSIPEILGDAGLFVQPHEPDSILAAMDALVSQPDLRPKLIERGTARAAKFCWIESARQVVTIYRAVLDQPRFATPETSGGSGG